MKMRVARKKAEARETRVELDCRTCGACCVNPDENKRVRYIDYVDVRPDDELLARPGLMQRLVVPDKRGQPHLRLLPDGRCAALRGVVGEDVRCGIYAVRPTVCREFQPGGRRCLELRRERGVDP